MANNFDDHIVSYVVGGVSITDETLDQGLLKNLSFCMEHSRSMGRNLPTDESYRCCIFKSGFVFDTCANTSFGNVDPSVYFDRARAIKAEYSEHKKKIEVILTEFSKLNKQRSKLTSEIAAIKNSFMMGTYDDMSKAILDEIEELKAEQAASGKSFTKQKRLETLIKESKAITENINTVALRNKITILNGKITEVNMLLANKASEYNIIASLLSNSHDHAYIFIKAWIHDAPEKTVWLKALSDINCPVEDRLSIFISRYDREQNASIVESKPRTGTSNVAGIISNQGGKRKFPTK